MGNSRLHYLFCNFSKLFYTPNVHTHTPGQSAHRCSAYSSFMQPQRIENVGSKEQFRHCDARSLVWAVMLNLLRAISNEKKKRKLIRKPKADKHFPSGKWVYVQSKWMVSSVVFYDVLPSTDGISPSVHIPFNIQIHYFLIPSSARSVII